MLYNHNINQNGDGNFTIAEDLAINSNTNMVEEVLTGGKKKKW